MQYLAVARTDTPDTIGFAAAQSQAGSALDCFGKCHYSPVRRPLVHAEHGGRAQRERLLLTAVTGGGLVAIGNPPQEHDRDWIALVKLDGPPAKKNEPPPVLQK